MRWLIGVIVAAGIAVFGVWFQANYVPRLQVVHVDGVPLQINAIETAIHGESRTTLFEVQPEFKNDGLREGSLARCEVKPFRANVAPTVELTHLDSRPIPRGAIQKRTVAFRAEFPANPAPYELAWSIDCWDNAGTDTGTLYTIHYPNGEKPTPINPQSGS
jgi:hypothetical protein